MIKVEAIIDFKFKDFEKIYNLKRHNLKKDNYIFKGDKFECSKETADYLLGENPEGITAIRLLEVKPVKKKASKK